MEWVETTGRTVEDAKEAALDELGVDETDAEFEVLAEPGIGLFGRLRSEARVRARVRPTAPRAKEDRRDRRRRERSTGNAAAAAPPAPAVEVAVAPGPPAASETESGDAGAGPESPAGPSNAKGAGARRAGGGGRGRNRQGNGESRNGSGPHSDGRREGAEVEIPLEEQGRVAQEFLRQLTSEFGLDATVTVTLPDEDTVDLHVQGADLGLLIGPKGATLLALQDLTRTVVHHQTGGSNGRLHVDVGGYRQRRAEALARFAVQVANSVRQSGVRTALEPMTAADRKVVHDAITSIDGVSTISEGEDPNRRVIVLPGGS